MGHLKTGPPETALDVETLVGFTAVENALVAANLVSDEIEGLDDSEAELLALLILGHGNVLDVSDSAKVMDTMTSVLALRNSRRFCPVRLTICAQRSRRQFQRLGAQTWLCPR